MSGLSITVCSFYLSKRNVKKNKIIYALNESIKYTDNNENESETTIYDILQDFSKLYFDSVKEEKKKKTFSCEFIETKDTDNFTLYTFQIVSGYYGSASTIVDAETREKKYDMKPSDVAEKNFYVYIIIPKDNRKVTVNKGMMIFQNIGIFGVKTITCDYLVKYLAENYNITLKCATVSPELFIKKVLIKENLKKMILIKNYKSTDPTDQYYTGYGSECRILSNFRFDDTKWNKIISEINNIVKGKTTVFELEDIPYDNLKVEVSIGERKRTINLQSIENLSIIEPIPDSIMNNKGYADLSKLSDYIIQTANEYLKEMVLHIK